MANNLVDEYVSALLTSERLGSQVAHHELLPAREAAYADPKRPWPKAMSGILEARGIDRLYAHQALATDIIRSGRDVMVSTPTASGKTFIFNLPVIERCLADPDSRALYLFPLKALAQDQLKTFESMTAHWPKDARPRAAIYDGDTTSWFRRKIREHPPNVLLTNPEMLHLSICPFHERWAEFLAGLSFVVVDEVHTYRGVLGSHMAQVFRRLQRVCARYGQHPNFVFCSATIGNPEELARNLTGVDATLVDTSGAPQGARHFIFINPDESPAQAAIMLLQAALHRGMRTIVYTQSRKMTELISIWASQRSGKFKDKISAYRAGYLPEERREIEAKMHSGELLAVISTSALELGIDIGSLDLCILVGYPGSIMATLQRGGRVGRSKQASAVALIAQEDALDQYFMRNPKDFFERPPECAVLDPHNPVLLGRHLECAAAEMALRDGEPWLQDPQAAAVEAGLEAKGRLLRSADGKEIYAARKRPHRDVSLRGSGSTFCIEIGGEKDAKGKGTIVGHLDEHRAYKEAHEGAVYIHLGRTFVVESLDIATKTVRVTEQHVDYYTRPRGNKSTEIIEQQAQRIAWGTRVHLGRLRVTETVTGYEKRRVRGGNLMGIFSLDLPPLVFETQGIWIEIPLEAQRRAEDAFMHFMGGIHAVEHAAIGILPLLILTDRNDLGGISTPMHPQVGMPSVFIYDGIPGGVGLSAQAFAKAEELLDRTLAVIAGCECELGCPSCVHSPKCGSGNRPIDKAAALFLLEQIKSLPAPTTENIIECTDNSEDVMIMKKPAENETVRITDASEPQENVSKNTPENSKEVLAMSNEHYGVLDIETQRSAKEVGGWNHPDRMGVSVAVLYDSATDRYETFLEEAVPELIERLFTFDLVVGFNIRRFDYGVLKGYTKKRLSTIPTLDMLEKVHERLGYRISLDNLAQATLDAEKSADGLQALEWWKEGRIDEIISYCTKDVVLTRDIFIHGRENGFLLFTNKAGKKVRVPVSW